MTQTGITKTDGHRGGAFDTALARLEQCCRTRLTPGENGHAALTLAKPFREERTSGVQTAVAL